jgi:DedD protein
MVKQRLVGFIVLGALAVIFWPIVFVSPEPEQELVLPVFEMPERPAVAMSERREPVLERVDRSRLPTIERTAPSEGAGIDEVNINPSFELIAADTEPRSQDSSRQRADFDDQGLPVSWALQVATLSLETRAEEIAADLRNKGHKAYVSPVTIGTQQLFRVRIGPNLQRQRLIEIQPDIDAYFGVKSTIIKFEV